MTSQYYITKTTRTENNLNNHNIFPLLIHTVHIVHLHTKTIRGVTRSCRTTQDGMFKSVSWETLGVSDSWDPSLFTYFLACRPYILFTFLMYLFSSFFNLRPITPKTISFKTPELSNFFVLVDWLYCFFRWPWPCIQLSNGHLSVRLFLLEDFNKLKHSGVRFLCDSHQLVLPSFKVVVGPGAAGISGINDPNPRTKVSCQPSLLKVIH